MSTCDSTTDLEHLLTAFIGDPQRNQRFVDAASPHLLRFARRFAPFLPKDLLQDVVSETLLSLLRLAPGSFDPRRGSAVTFLQFHVRHAVRRVRAAHCAPGQKTRGRWNPAAADAPLDDNVADTSTATLRQEPVDVVTRIAAREVMNQAPRAVGRVLYSMYFEGRTLRETSRRAGVDHSSLGRKVRAFCEKVRTAA